MKTLIFDFNNYSQPVHRQSNVIVTSEHSIDVETTFKRRDESIDCIFISFMLHVKILKMFFKFFEFFNTRAGMHRRNFDFNASVDDLLLAMDKLGYDANNSLYSQAQKQLILTFNDFAVDCFRYKLFLCF